MKNNSILNVTLRRSWVLVVLFICFYQFGLTQDSKWLKVVTNEVGLDDAHGSRILHADVNGDNYPDLLWGTGNIQKNRFFLLLNIPNPDTDSPYKRIYKDVTESSNINVNRNSEEYGRIIDCASFADVDNDGDLDLVTSIYYHRWEYYNTPEKDPGDRSEVLLNDGTGHFTMVDNSGLTDVYIPEMMAEGLTNTTGISFLDYDQDGNIDMYFAEWFSDYKSNLEGKGAFKLPDMLFKGNGDGTFQLVHDPDIDRIVQPMYGVNVTDWNNDGWQDIITSPYCRSGGSLFENMKDGTFRDATFTAKYSSQKMGGDHGQPLCQWEANPADFDNDGDMDLLQVEVHGGYDKGEGRTHISINQGADEEFEYVWDLDRIERDAPSNSHLGDQGGAWFDLDNDTRLDLSVQQMGYLNANTQGQSRLYICKQNKEKYFKDISDKLGIKESMKQAHSLEPCDYDLDGDLDLFVSRQVTDTIKTDTGDVYDTHMQITLLQNEIGNLNNWTGIKLDQPAEANQSGIGSRIYIKSDTITQIREIQAGLGHFANQQQFIRFAGLGNINRIDEMIVRWPNADIPETHIYNPPINLIIKADNNGYAGYIKTWEGNEPLIHFEKPFLAFDTVKADETIEMTCKIKNIGEDNLAIHEIVFSDNEMSQYFVIEDVQLPLVIAPGESYPLKIEFNPDKRQHFDGDILFRSNAYNAANKRFDIYGYGHEDKPVISINKNNIEFESVWIDSTDKQIITIQNVGEKKLTIDNISFSEHSAFYLDNSEFPMEIDPQEEHQLTVVFHPDEIKEYTENMLIDSDGYYNPQLSIQLKGICNGPSPQISLSTSNIFFGSVRINEHEDEEFTITNDGNSLLSISDFIFEENAENYQIPDLTTPVELEINESKEFTLRFAPKKEGVLSTVLYFESNALNNNNMEIRITGRGKEALTVHDNIVSLDGLRLEVSPNPFRNQLYISYSVNSSIVSNLRIELYGSTGQKIDNILDRTAATGENSIVYDVQNISDGLYYLIIKYNDNISTIPVIKMR